jgi:hypothetical protein
MKSAQAVSGIVLSLSIGLMGCYKTVRTVPMATVPAKYRTASAAELEKLVQDRDAAIKTLYARVEINVTSGGSHTGTQMEAGPFKGFILVRKPFDLHVLLQVPVMGSRGLDMVSDRDNFTLMYKTLDKGEFWRQGPNKVTTTSANPMENLRPPVFFDSLLVPGVGPDDYVNLAESDRLIQPSRRGESAVEEPDYDMAIMTAAKSGARLLDTRRVLHISRVNMLPYDQDIYGENGHIVTSASYDGYKEFDGVQFPTLITISRPLDQLVLKIQVTSVTLNGALTDDEFKLDVPEGVTVQKMQ